mmetsp:Transcript_2737/g.8495  ORF Transcript_2737/g.8495 Transcript_2737/m.8495 type:complete len:203 (-) Transcript_2737:177-785(-)
MACQSAAWRSPCHPSGTASSLRPPRSRSRSRSRSIRSRNREHRRRLRATASTGGHATPHGWHGLAGHLCHDLRSARTGKWSVVQLMRSAQICRPTGWAFATTCICLVRSLEKSSFVCFFSSRRFRRSALTAALRARLSSALSPRCRADETPVAVLIAPSSSSSSSSSSSALFLASLGAGGLVAASLTPGSACWPIGRPRGPR